MAELQYKEFEINGARVSQLACEQIEIVLGEPISIQSQLDAIMLALADIYEKVGGVVV